MNGVSPALRVLDALGQFASQFATEARQTLREIESDFLARGEAPPQAVLSVWRLRVESWETLVTSYVASAGLEPPALIAVERALAGLLAWTAGMKPDDEDAGS